MITIKDAQALQKMHTAGQYLAELFQALESEVIVGKSTQEIDAWIEKYLLAKGMISQTKGFKTYKHASCISLNDEVVHGVPNVHRVLKEGDLVKIDICASWKDYCADATRCYYVGDVDESVKKFVAVAQRSLDVAIEKALVGAHLSDISAAVQQEVESHGYGVVREFAGHGIGRRMHEEPEILNYGPAGKGPRLKAGMTFAIEPMITMGDYHVYVAKDGWTIKTLDKSMAAHVEDTVAITENGPKILTRFSSI
jgi:methionyl aminopeptidase